MRRVSLAVALFLLFAFSLGCQAESVTTDALKFKAEHEVMNGQMNLDGTEVYAVLDIPEDNPVVYLDEAGVRALFEEGGMEIFYLGFPECPWCRTLIPVLLEAVKASNYDGNIYYYNALLDRDSKYLDDDGNIVTEEEGTELYHYMLDKLHDHLWAYAGLEDETVKRIYFPSVAFIKDGKVVSLHISTVSTQVVASEPLTEEQHAELLNTLVAQIASIQQ